MSDQEEEYHEDGEEYDGEEYDEEGMDEYISLITRVRSFSLRI